MLSHSAGTPRAEDFEEVEDIDDSVAGDVFRAVGAGAPCAKEFQEVKYINDPIAGDIRRAWRDRCGEIDCALKVH